MPSFRPPAVGIDLGTTFSVVAHLDEHDRPQTLANAEGERLTPSAVLVEGNETIVGREALKALTSNAANVALCAKRELGASAFHKRLDGHDYPPEVIEALVLNKLWKDAKSQIGDFNQVVITVPAYFDEVRRKATQDAGYMAGLEVLDIINEPTAAAVAFGVAQGFLTRDGKPERAINLLVYDLGGGTFDVTVMRFERDQFTTLATDGDVRLGGYDWDQRLVDFVGSEFQRRYGQDPRMDETTASRLWRECEEAKRTLSFRSKAAVAMDYQGHHLRTDVSREAFEMMTSDLLDRTRFTVEQTLRTAGAAWSGIDRILLVGGSTRMPMVVRMLMDISQKAPDTSISADEAVAHGAALRAGILIAQGGHPLPFSIRNVNSHSLGVVGTDPATGRPRTGVLIPRNTHLPVTAKRTFQTQRANQKTILIEVVEGESASPGDCSLIGQCIARNLPPGLPAKTPIDVHFRYEENGRLKIAARLADGQRVLSHTLHRDNMMNQEQLDAWRRYIAESIA